MVRSHRQAAFIDLDHIQNMISKDVFSKLNKHLFIATIY
ncbi:hypothetical protein O185_24020 [Photorhabdus temperata J3]|uniref:Uncharacterized protein n=1 Tax=Photorhabdus temperata J3 TaxID=1389415 RepID=U7QRU9_PHOTE|nr:hypothetical protein O185_24020 [Photorhabdus temperata J3]